MTRSKVAVLRVRPDHILDDIDRLHELAGVTTALAKGASTILKDNISWHFPFPGANTTPWQLEGTIRSLRARGYADLVCVQNKTVVTDAFKGEDLNGYVPIFRTYDIPVLYNFKDGDMEWVRIQPKAKMLVLDKIFPEGIHVPDYFTGKNIVHLPTIKCHIYTTTTGAMKNAFGGLLNTRRHYTHSWIHETLVDLLAIQKEIHSDIFWFGPLKPIQNMFMRTPLVNIFIAGSEVYHDYYRWPLKDRRTFEVWLERSPWGHLFQE